MLFKKKRRFIPIVLLICGGLFFVSCSKKDENTPVDDTTTTDDDTGTTDDNTPGPFLGEIDWIKTYGGSDIDQAVAIVEADDGNYVVAGSTRSTDGELASKPTSDSDYWVLKISSADGSIMWNKVYGGTEDEVASSITKTSDGGYVLSGYSRSPNDQCGTQPNAGFHDYWLLKIDGNGNEMWCQNFGYSGSDQAFDVFETNEGGYFATGFFDVSASGGEGNNDRQGAGNAHGVGEFWAIKMDSDGEFIWTRYFGGYNNDRSYDALQTPDNGFLLIGSSESIPEENSDIELNHGSYDFWVVKVNSAGTKEWTKTYGGIEIDVAYAITPTPDGNYFIVGDSRSIDQDVSNNYGNADVWLIKISPTGQLLMEKNFGGSQFDSAKSILPISDGNYLISGATRSQSNDVSANNGENDAWVFVIDASGTLLFEKAIGGSALDFAEDAIQSNGKLIVVGNTESNDGDIPINKGIKDLLIVKIR
ncbi:hypothetical protein KXJ69_03170 [Aureisphaera sp. CAU 1614]|uniref:Bulb-type lectin domain-containing protein n=1 Tax=Halomarinibacterium sedimenti TaxID=2857106 RepID=A0A9X1FM42_9FLAO|nr:hypothetical protein [Halomarinibacterium sedimenti]MBW2937090.1 hypothetical protein [Halomarinibacterium sedimenti]